MSIEFSAEHFDLLEDALREMGYSAVQRGADYVSFYAENGRVEIRGGKINLNERDRGLIDRVKQQYSKQVLKKAASRYGWALKETANNKFVANKR